MNIQEIITITENKLKNLEVNLSSYLINGDLDNYESTKTEIEETKETLNKLNSL